MKVVAYRRGFSDSLQDPGDEFETKVFSPRWMRKLKAGKPVLNDPKAEVPLGVEALNEGVDQEAAARATMGPSANGTK
jgi:hypothetical protein